MPAPKRYIIISCVVALYLCALPGNVWALAESTAAGGTNAQAVHTLGITGAGVNIGLVSQDNTRITHEAFKDDQSVSHAFAYDFSGDGLLYSNHDTWVAGVAVSRGGAAYPNQLGVAYGSDIHSARVVSDGGSLSFSWLENALNELAVNQDCRVIVTGISITSVTADGQSNWAKLYDYYAFEHNVFFANAAGNSTTEISIFGDAYNGITTGGLNTSTSNIYDYVGLLSGEGPTVDGRKKPEVAGPVQNQTVPSGASDTSWYTWPLWEGGGQTSFSAPHTAGVAALLLELADNTPESNDNKNVVLKAVIVNSTYPNINDKDDNPTTGLVWHSQRGYGRLDALRAYELLNSGKISKGVIVNQPKGWAYASMTLNYQNDTYLITGKKNQILLLTAVWNRKITKSGSIYSAETGFNIDVSVEDPLGSVIFSETDSLNNLEKAELLLDMDGVYEINIKNKTIIDRDYGLAFELIDPLVGDFEPINHSVDLDDLIRLAEDWGSTGSGLETDIKPDGVIDYLDFAIFAQNWLQINPAYYIP
ncbi:MAG: S8 family serine peptidase [Sedimentisphaerales bacterium]|nr:S8 family serine peptidase [Sedimentisphaerales bacterium]